MSTRIHKALTPDEIRSIQQAKQLVQVGAITRLEQAVDYAEACTDYKALIKLLTFKLLRKLRDERK